MPPETLGRWHSRQQFVARKKSNVYHYQCKNCAQFLQKYSKNYATKTSSLNRTNLNQYVWKPRLDFSSQKLGQQMIPLWSHLMSN